MNAKKEHERAERYRRRCSVLLRALEGCLDADKAWNGGMAEIYEFIRARKLVERYRRCTLGDACPDRENFRSDLAHKQGCRAKTI